MTKTRTTIKIPVDLLKQAKYRAIENNTNLSDWIARLIRLRLKHKRLVQQTREEKAALINKLAGGFKLGIKDSPQQLKKIFEQSYYEEMLS